MRPIRLDDADDTYGEEASDNARVWRLYRNEAALEDDTQLDGWNRTLDILLIFSGLFSAVSTAFIVESYKSLAPDPIEYMADALFVIANAQNASFQPRAPASRTLGRVPISVISRWVNALWLASLVLSLAVALLSILAKQWMQDYQARIAAPSLSAVHWARRHALFSDGLRRWHVPGIISALPAALHLALFLFLSGLVLFFASLDRAIAWMLFGIVLFTLSAYILSIVLPLCSTACPFRTPVTAQLLALRASFRRFTTTITLSLTTVTVTFLGHVSPFPLLSYMHKFLEHIQVNARKTLLLRTRTVTEVDDAVIERRSAFLDAVVLRHLLTASQTGDAGIVAAHAIGAFPPESPTVSFILQDGGGYDLFAILSDLFHDMGTSSFDPYYGSARIEYARNLRTVMALSRHWIDIWRDFEIRWSYFFWRRWVHQPGRDIDYDLGLLEAAMNWRVTGRHEPLVTMVNKSCELRSEASAYLAFSVVVTERIESPSHAIDAGLQLLRAAGGLSRRTDSDLVFIHGRLSSVLRLLMHDRIEHLPTVPAVRCLALWTEIATEHAGLGLQDSLLDVVIEDMGNLVCMIRQRTHPDALTLTNISFWVHFVASPKFSRALWAPRTLFLALGLLRDAYRSEEHCAEPPLQQSDGAPLHLLSRAVSNLAHRIFNLVQERQILPVTGAFWIADWFSIVLDPRSKHPAMLDLGLDPSDTILQFLDESSFGTTWGVLQSLRCEPKRLFVLAGVLAANLCAMRRRGVNVDGSVFRLVERALSVLRWRTDDDAQYGAEYHCVTSSMSDGWIADSIRLAHSLGTTATWEVWYPWDSRQFEHLAQHCAELSSHWTEVCIQVSQSEDANESLREFASHAGDILRWKGKCIECR